MARSRAMWALSQVPCEELVTPLTLADISDLIDGDVTEGEWLVARAAACGGAATTRTTQEMDMAPPRKDSRPEPRPQPLVTRVVGDNGEVSEPMVLISAERLAQLQRKENRRTLHEPPSYDEQMRDQIAAAVLGHLLMRYGHTTGDQDRLYERAVMDAWKLADMLLEAKDGP